MTNNTPLYVGIDGGGSKCSAILFNAKGAVLSQGIAGSANAARDFSNTLVSIVESVRLALINAGLGSDSMAGLQVGAGLAGACVPSVNSQLKSWKHPFASFSATSDLMTACYGAHGGNEGALLIVGTGSSAARMQNNKLTQFGGHGFVLGDKGSGAWFGRAAVASTLEALDGLIPLSDLHDMVLNKLGLNSSAALVQTMINASPSQFATLAPDIIELALLHDLSALNLVKEGAAYLDKLCLRTLHGTSLSMVLMGGLAPSIEHWFSPELRQRIVKAQAGPEWGAMRLLQTPELMAC
ncbi:BadF/BadG/BcrA/BcrD ATPase family protein [Paraglaciecola hydrolytica]|nr:BadF/BadG/BcrA/BcrD ATPase family protein [Paraglaciecola hydrolytica]